MATAHVDTDNGSSMTSLVSGIINDGQELLKQQLHLFQVELTNDLRRTRDASIPLVIGGMVATIGALFLFVTVALWIPWQWPSVPLWASFAIVTGIFLIAGTILVFMGKTRFDAFNPLPDKSVEGLKENVQWKTKT
jgi:uncharacterized membrane protein YqjE